MNVNELVENYCQITGRPAFTITVDEYIKFHQVARFNSPKEIVYTNEVVKQEKKEEQKQEKEEKKEVIKEDVSLSSLAKHTLEIEPKMEREGELKPPTKTSVETKTEKKPTVSALDMLKSIQG